jgi:hypothetical protein
MTTVSRLAVAIAFLSCGPAPATGPTAPTPIARPPEPTPVATPEEPRIDEAVLARVKSLWLSLDGSEESCGDFDYFPNGGMKSFACHLALGSTLPWLTGAWGKEIFVDGPHSPGALDLQNSRSFGHYNPRFVRFLVDHLVPAATDPAFRERTQPLYDAHVKPLAQIFLATYNKLEANPECRDREVARFQALLDGPGVPAGDYERYFYFMNKEFCDNPDGDFNYFSSRGFDGGFSGNVVKTCTAFWIRRNIDGTAAAFHEGLVKLIETYEATPR